MNELHYSIIMPIKESNKGKVCLAKVEGYEFPVIVKELKHGNKAVFQSLRALQSVYIPKIYEVREATDRLLVVEEYIEGELLSDYLTSEKLTEAEWLDVAKQLCEALKSLHALEPPIIHRDIKPSNIVIDSKGRVKLIDFDSSRLYKTESEGDTRLLGTERYAPPEQYGFSQTDCRSDIYSLGVVFGMFPPFASKTRQKQWKQIVEKCTLFAPESRFQSAEAVEKEVNKLIGSKPIRRTVYVCTGVIVLLLVAAFGLFGDKLTPATESKAPTPTSAPVTEQELPTQTSAPATEQELPTPTSIPLTEAVNPTPTSIPVTGVVESVVSDEEDENRNTPPEQRELASDIPAYVSLKERIRNEQLTVSCCFKDRVPESGYLLQVTWLDQPQIEFRRMDLYSYRDDRTVAIDKSQYEVCDSIIRIDREYLQTLEEGYYNVVVFLYNAEERHNIDHSMVLYVGESDAWEEQEWWLQNTTLSFFGAENKTIYAAVAGDSSREMTAVFYPDRTPVDSSLYQILYDGKAVAFSNELLNGYRNQEFVEFLVTSKDGADALIRVNNCVQDDLK